MRGTKIMALHLGEIIKTLIFVIAGIAIVLLLINLFAPSRGATANDDQDTARVYYIPGAYNVTLELSTGSIEIEVIVSENEILNVGFIYLPEEQQVFYPLFKPTMEILQVSILENQNLAVAVPEDRMITGQVLLSAIDQALSQAMVEN